jgi:hypothetical protein
MVVEETCLADKHHKHLANDRKGILAKYYFNN